MSKHTPGPWEVSPSDECRVNVAMNTFLDPDEPRIATKEEADEDDSFHDDWNICQADGDHYARSHKECVANARLIAAAPDLLAACEAVEEWMGECETLYGHESMAKQVAAAIAKATGK